VLIDGYLASRECLRGLVVVMDSRHPLTPFDRMLLDWAATARLPCHLLLTKADKLASGARRTTLREVEKELPLLHAQASAQLFSSQSGAGVEEARQLLARWLSG
jgi:GTP-binding protein